jgi:hypothetical protein
MVVLWDNEKREFGNFVFVERFLLIFHTRAAFFSSSCCLSRLKCFY